MTLPVAMRPAVGLMLVACLGAASAAPAPPAVRVATDVTPAQARELMQALLVASPYRLPAPARNGHIRYRLDFGDAAAVLPQTHEQQARSDAQGVQVDVCAGCGHEPAPDAAALARYLAPNPWVESDDRRIRVFAGQSDRGQSLDRRMDALRDAVRAHVNGTIDFSRYDSAARVLETRSGDCTEVALLFAAAARARGIPARVVYGVAYSSRITGKSHVFSPHMWVQAWDGAHWRSFDAGLERFDAGYIALAVGDGDPAAYAPAAGLIRKMRIKAATGVAPSAGAGASVGR